MSTTESSGSGQAPQRTPSILSSKRRCPGTSSRLNTGSQSRGKTSSVRHPGATSRVNSTTHSRGKTSSVRHPGSASRFSHRSRSTPPAPPPGVGDDVRRTGDGVWFSLVDLCEQVKPNVNASPPEAFRLKCRRVVTRFKKELGISPPSKVITGGSKPTPCADADTCVQFLAWWSKSEEEAPEADDWEDGLQDGEWEPGHQAVPFGTGRQDFEWRELQGWGDGEVLDEAAVLAIEDPAERERIVRAHRERVVEIDDGERYKKTLEGIKGMLANSKHPPLRPKFWKLRREEGELHFDFSSESRVCRNGLNHNGPNQVSNPEFTVRVQGRNCFYKCKGFLCATWKPELMGRLALGATRENAAAEPVSLTRPSLLTALDLKDGLLKTIDRSQLNAAKAFKRSNDDGRISVDIKNKFWVWNGWVFVEHAEADMNTLVSNHLQTIARAVQLEEARAAAFEAKGQESSDEDGDESNGSVGQKRPAPVPGLGGLGKKARLAVLNKLGNSNYISGVLSFLKNELREPDLLDSLDQTPTLFPCPNGVLDLETGRLSPPHPRFLQTFQTDVRYPTEEPEPGSFKAFIEDIFNHDQEMIDFVQLVLGYCSTGDTSQSIFVNFVSPGSSGKTVLVNILQAALGRFFFNLPRDALTGKPKANGAPDSNLKAMKGKRLAFSEETGKGAKWNAEWVKAATGGGMMPARGVMEKTPTADKITAKLGVSTNHLPRFDGKDEAMERRMIVIPFPIKYVARLDESNPNPRHRLENPILKELLVTEEAKEEALYWLVEGAKKFFAKKKAGDGAFLKDEMPQACKDAVREYVNVNGGDLVDSFIDAHCKVDKKNKALFETTGRLFKKFKATEGASSRVNRASFGKALKNKGFDNNGGNKVYIPETGAQKRGFFGISLKA